MATHTAEDIVEFFMWEQIHESCYPSMSEFKLQTKGQYEHWELKLATKEIESIAEKVMEIKNSIIVKDARHSDETAASSSSSVAPIHKDAMVGFDNDLMGIISRLLRESFKREVVPILGMGGIGKTTLARNAYDHPSILKHFDIFAWVTVSQDYSIQEIVSGLLVSMKVFDVKNKPTGANTVYQNLKGRRYLIVLDDMWSINAWDDLQMMFPNDGNVRRIILTIRLFDVASYVGFSSPIHKIRLMDEDQSWNLLQWKVFKRDPCPVKLEYVGRMIAGSCRGLPLAIVVISGLLTVRQAKEAWENIAKDVKSAISAKHKQVDKILSLSYTNLPHHLRPCVLYMGGFPKYYEMHVSKLVKLWAAEGFLKPKLSKSYEETAEEYLEDLVKRSLVLVTKRESDGRIKNLCIHDLVREMCIRKAWKERFFLHVGRSLRQGICISHFDVDFHKNFYGSTIRTIIHLRHRGRGTQCDLGYFRLLRILDLSGSFDFFFSKYFSFFSLPPLPDELFELFHLRYLLSIIPLKFRQTYQTCRIFKL